MDFLYWVILCLHILTAAFWIGAMFFGDPESTRFFSKLFERKLGGVGWYAQAVLWVTGIFLLSHNGMTVGKLFSADVMTDPYSRAAWVKILLVVTLGVFQVTVGHRPSKLIYGYILVAFAAVGVGVLLARPHLIFF